MKNRLFTLIFATSLLITSPFKIETAYCTPNEVTETMTEAQTVEIGDELTSILHTNTEFSEETPCQVSGNFDIPTGFNLAAYVEFQASDGTIYQITATDENDYVDYAFVPYGEYSVLSYGIVGDVKNEYPLTLLSDETFTLDEDNQLCSLTIQINNYKEISKIITERTNGEIKMQFPKYQIENDIDITKLPNNVETVPTYFENISLGSDNNLYYDVSSSDKKINTLCYGYALRDYDIYMEVIEDGYLEEAKIAVYLDGKDGVCSGTDYLTKEYSLKSIGLNFYFDVEDDYIFKNGDTFSVKVPQYINFSSTNVKDGTNMIACLDKSTVSNDFKLSIDVISNGKRGKAKVSIVKNEDADNRQIFTIGEDGIVKYEGFTFYFSDTEFEKNNNWFLDYKYSSDTINYFPLYAILGITVVFLLIGYIWLMSKKEKPIDYKIISWKDRQDADIYE